MRYEHPVELPGRGWHYASTSSRGGYPLGYCAEHEPHATETEARECYGRYQREHVRLDGKTTGWHDCEVCKAPAKNVARIDGDGYSHAVLCDEHLTKDHAATVLGIAGLAGDRWVS